MVIFSLLIFCFVCLSACLPMANPMGVDASSAGLPAQDALTLSNDTLQLNITPPQNWTAHAIIDHIVLSEKRHPINRDRQMDGFVVNIWLPALDHVPDAATYSTQDLLGLIVKSPDFVRHSAINDPRSLEWAGYDAAYYLLADERHVATVVLALRTMDSDRLIAMNITASVDDMVNRFDGVLPTILSGVSVNMQPIDYAAMPQMGIANTLIVSGKARRGGPEAAMEVSPVGNND